MSLIPDISFTNNNEERLPLILVLDCSGSMSGKAIDELNNGLKILENELKKDSLVSQSVRVLVISFGGGIDEVNVITSWTDALDFTAPVLKANGDTPTGKAMKIALEEIEIQKQDLRENGISYKRPLLFIMSDGEPSYDWEKDAEKCLAAQKAKKLTVFSIAIGDEANVEILRAFSEHQTLRMKGIQFKEFFVWLSQSVTQVSQSASGSGVKTQLPPPSQWAMSYES